MKLVSTLFSFALAAGLALLPLRTFAADTATPAHSASHSTRAGVARVRGGDFHYVVHGDLQSKQTPLLVLHGAYMSSDGMTPFVEGLAKTRPVIVFDQRGHGRTGDLPGAITYEALADDAAALLDAIGVAKADVLGYSMGGGAAMLLAIRHPQKVAKLITISAGTRLDSVYPEVLQGIAHITPAMFDNTAMRREYDRLAPRPQDFAVLVDKLKALDATAFDCTREFAALGLKTMIIVGDYDVVATEHAVALFRARKGGSPAIAAQAFFNEPPPARLLVLPATSHLGILGAAESITAQVTPFLDDVTPALPAGFF